MLPEVIEPVLRNEDLNVSTRISRVGEMLPEQGAIAPPDMAHALENFCKRLGARRVDAIVNRHHDWTAIVWDGADNNRSRPMPRRPVICRALRWQPPPAGQNAGNRQPAGCNDEGCGYSRAVGESTPHQAAERDGSAQDHLHDGKASGLDP